MNYDSDKNYAIAKLDRGLLQAEAYDYTVDKNDITSSTVIISPAIKTV